MEGRLPVKASLTKLVLFVGLLIVILCMAGCIEAPARVVVDSPRLSFALVFVGVCAVLSTSIGGACLVKACRAKKK